mgnify:FL=1
MRQAMVWVNKLGGQFKAARHQRLQKKLHDRLGKLVSYGLS